MRIEDQEFTLHIPKKDGSIELVRIMAPCEWDEEVQEWLVTPEAHKLIDETKARLMGVPCPKH